MNSEKNDDDQKKTCTCKNCKCSKSDKDKEKSQIWANYFYKLLINILYVLQIKFLLI